MFKFFLKIILIVIILFSISQYTNYLFTGKTPNINFQKPALPKLSNITDTINNKIDSLKSGSNEQIVSKESFLYKWRDENGVIHYTSERPKEYIKSVESIKIDNNTNVVPSVTDNTSDTNEINNPQPSQQQSSPATELPANIYSPEGIKHLFDQAKGIQDLVNDQFSQQENIINNQ